MSTMSRGLHQEVFGRVYVDDSWTGFRYIAVSAVSFMCRGFLGCAMQVMCNYKLNLLAKNEKKKKTNINEHEMKYVDQILFSLFFHLILILFLCRKSDYILLFLVDTNEMIA